MRAHALPHHRPMLARHPAPAEIFLRRRPESPQGHHCTVSLTETFYAEMGTDLRDRRLGDSYRRPACPVVVSWARELAFAKASITTAPADLWHARLAVKTLRRDQREAMAEAGDTR